MQSSHISALRRAIDIYGSQSALAVALGISRVAVGHWLKGSDDKARRNVPPKQCVRIESLTAGAVTRCELRPDDWAEIWPELSDSKQKPTKTPARIAQTATETVAQGVA